MRYHVYITASQACGTLYVGMTDDIARRIVEHREGTGSRFASKSKVTRLVHVNKYPTAALAIACEKPPKRWRPIRTIALVEEDHPHMHDLLETMTW